MNWLEKMAQTGYLDTQLFGKHQQLKNWNDITAEREQKRQVSYKQAEKTAEENGHTLKPWSSLNNTQCKKCGREVNIYNILSRSDTCFKGRALTQKCDDNIYDSSGVVWNTV